MARLLLREVHNPFPSGEPSGTQDDAKLVLAALAVSGAAFAQTKAPEPDYTLSYNVGVVTDYRYRGISQSRLKPALQGGVDFAHKSGFYLGTWASTIKWIKDAGGDAPVERDFYGGYKGTVGAFGYDVGVLTYQYPNHSLPVSPNTTEIYGAGTWGPATLKYSHAVTNLFGFADSKNSYYLDASATFDMGGGWSVDAARRLPEGEELLRRLVHGLRRHVGQGLRQRLLGQRRRGRHQRGRRAVRHAGRQVHGPHGPGAGRQVQLLTPSIQGEQT